MLLTVSQGLLGAILMQQLMVNKRFDTLKPRQNGRHFADDALKRIFLSENIRISSKITLKFVPTGPVNNIPALVQIVAWRRSGEKPLSEPMMVILLTHICVARPQWVNWQHLVGRSAGQVTSQHANPYVYIWYGEHCLSYAGFSWTSNSNAQQS